MSKCISLSGFSPLTRLRSRAGGIPSSSRTFVGEMRLAGEVIALAIFGAQRNGSRSDPV